MTLFLSIDVKKVNMTFWLQRRCDVLWVKLNEPFRT